SSATVPAVYVQDHADAAARVVVDAQMANGGDVVKAQVALNQMKALGVRDPKRALSYPAAREVRVRLRAPGAGSAVVDLPRVGVAGSAVVPPGRRPGGGAKENFDLSSFYSTEGAFADTDNNLIPDRVDVVLSPG